MNGREYFLVNFSDSSSAMLNLSSDEVPEAMRQFGDAGHDVVRLVPQDASVPQWQPVPDNTYRGNDPDAGEITVDGRLVIHWTNGVPAQGVLLPDGWKLMRRVEPTDGEQAK